MSTKRIYRSMQGKIVDMELLSQRNELTPAIGNMRVNARGDELGPGGKIIRKREDIINEYYEKNPNAVPDEQYKRAKLTSSPATTAKVDTKKTPVKKEVKNVNKENTSNS